MEKLKVFSAYLPFDLKIKTPNGYRPNRKESTGVSGIAYLTGDLYADLENKTFPVNKFKPILFSLEDLTKPITIGGETFVPIDELNKIKNVRLIVEKYKNGDKRLLNINTFSFSLFDFEYKIIEKLLEWKFNVFNLQEDEYVKVTDEFNPYK